MPSRWDGASTVDELAAMIHEHIDENPDDLSYGRHGEGHLVTGIQKHDCGDGRARIVIATRPHPRIGDELTPTPTTASMRSRRIALRLRSLPFGLRFFTGSIMAVACRAPSDFLR